MERGTSVTEALIGFAGVIFILLPLFTFVSEKYILFARVQLIRDSVDLSHMSLYNAISAERLSGGEVSLDEGQMNLIFSRILRKNLNLDENMEPLRECGIAGKVEVLSLEFHKADPVKGPSVSSMIVVPIKPVFFQNIILGMLERDCIELKIRVDSRIPVNN